MSFGRTPSWPSLGGWLWCKSTRSTYPCPWIPPVQPLLDLRHFPHFHSSFCYFSHPLQPADSKHYLASSVFELPSIHLMPNIIHVPNSSLAAVYIGLASTCRPLTPNPSSRRLRPRERAFRGRELESNRPQPSSSSMVRKMLEHSDPFLIRIPTIPIVAKINPTS